MSSKLIISAVCDRCGCKKLSEDFVSDYNGVAVPRDWGVCEVQWLGDKGWTSFDGLLCLSCLEQVLNMLNMSHIVMPRVDDSLPDVETEESSVEPEGGST